MPTTLRKITEQTSRLYARKSGRQVTKEMDKIEIRNLIIQSINKVLSAVHQSPEQEGSTPACIIATYKAQAISSDDGFYCPIPAQPIILARDQGLYSIGPDDANSERYIPIELKDWEMFIAMDEADIEGFTGFYREGTVIRFTSDPGATVRIKLLVADPATLLLDDILPIGADMEDVIIKDVAATMIGSGVSEI